MLEVAARKIAPAADAGGQQAIPLIEGDALRLPFIDTSFDGVTIAFGLRNLSNVERGLAELFRVLKPGGSLAVLEFSKPVIPGFSFLFQVYFTKLLPFVGGLISGSRSAYQYLPDSVSRFPDQTELVARMQQVGFERVEYQNLTGGIAALHLGMRPQ
jgi:demethylmenaquinone methyltransferase/2-methoxy-6-polyprenyl-1,4-benzoquinol methylase